MGHGHFQESLPDFSPARRQGWRQGGGDLARQHGRVEFQRNFCDCSWEPLIKSTMSRIAVKNEMIARRTTQVVVFLRSQGAQRRERSFLTQPFGTATLRAICGVRLLAKGITISFVAFLPAHPAKPLSRPCGT